MNRASRVFAAAGMLAALAASGCGGRLPDDTVFAAGGHVFPAEHFAAYLKHNTHPDALKEGIAPEALDALFRAYAEEQIILAAAAEAFPSGGERTLAELPAEEAMRLRARYIEEKIADAAEPTEAEIFAYYESRPDEFRTPERAAVRYMQLPDDESVRHVLRALQNGEATFADLAVRYASSRSETEVHTYARGSLPPEFEGAIFSLQPGGVSRPIETEQGVYLFELADLMPARRLDLDEARPMAARALMAERARARFAEHVAALEKRLSVTAFPERARALVKAPAPASPSSASEETSPS